MKKRAQQVHLARGILNKAARKRLNVIQKRNISQIEKLCSDYVSSPQLGFIMSQVKQGMKKGQGRRWTVKDKTFALSLLHSSPKTYRMLRTVFALPSVATLKLLMRRVQIYPGINAHILDALKLKLSAVPQSHRLVTLALDEMAIKEAVNYDAATDMVEGFSVELERSNMLANHANVFMLRGLIEKWKQPIGYYLSSGPMSGDVMVKLLRQCITKLLAVNIRPVAVVLDLGSNNRNMYYKHLHVMVDKPYFFIGDVKVFVLFDPPHLLKCVRNNLKNHGFEVRFI